MPDHPFSNLSEARAYIKTIGEKDESEIDMAESALALACLDHPGISIDKYRNHFKKIVEAVRHNYETDVKDEPDTAELRARILHDVLVGEFEYSGDENTYNDLQNGNIIRLIDRRMGFPIALGILYLHAGLSMGWDICGLQFPGHFLLRLSKDSERVIIDPFYARYNLDAAELRELLKDILGPEAELSHEFYDTVSKQDILIRLQNNLKIRLIENEDYQKALDVVQTMINIHPEEFRLLLDSGVLLAKLGHKKQAVDELEDYVTHLPDGLEKFETQELIKQIKATDFD